MAEPGQAALNKKWMQNSEFFVAIGVVSVIMMMIIPLPTFILDLLLAVNLTIAVVVILTVVYSSKAIEFSIFPSLLLLTTVFRLALNVSSTRLILLQGAQFEGKIIRAFGTFVVGGNYVVGIVIFLVLVMIQFLVITKGTTRVSEVAARFTLDAMPGKQMSIDADLNAGNITPEEANKRRMEIRQEADFYGAMDGASKFVQGDVVAGLVITAINILGGIVIGVWLRGEPFYPTALQTYTLLTVGDGLVNQIPSLLISVATGLIVTRAASKDNMGKELTTQLLSQPRALLVASGLLVFLGVFTPLPAIPMVSIGLICGAIGITILRNYKDTLKKEKDKEKEKELEKIKKPENVVSLLHVDMMELEIGYSLIPIVDPEQGGDLLDRVTMIRRQMALELGIIVPPIRIRDNMQLLPSLYSIKIKGVEVGRGEIEIDHYLAMNPGNITERIPGKETKEPAFGLPAIWIRDRDRERAEMLGYTVVDPPSVIATHITEIIKKHGYELLGRQEVKKLIENIKESYPAVVDELIPKIMTEGEIQKVLHILLKEGISVRDFLTILETLADYGLEQKDPALLTEYVRQALSRQICRQYSQEDGKLHVITLDSELQDRLVSSLQNLPEGPQIVLPPESLHRFFDELKRAADEATAAGYSPVILCSAKIRRHLKNLTSRYLPSLVIMSYNEVIKDIEIKSIGVVKK